MTSLLSGGTSAPASTPHEVLLSRLRQSPSAAARMLPDLLEALEWAGEPIQLRNALCGQPEAMDLVDVLNTLANLGYERAVKEVGPALHRSLAAGAFPLLLQGPAWDAGFQLVRSAGELPAAGSLRRRTFANRFTLAERASAEPRQWFQAQVLRFRGVIWQLYLISFFLNLLALILPFYIASVYGAQIPTGQVGQLFSLLPLALAAVALQIWMSQRREALLARLGSQLNFLLTIRLLERALRLRLPQLSRFSPLTLSSRLRAYQGLQTFVTGPLAQAALDLPFTVFYLIAIATISLPLAGLTLVMVVLCMGGVWLVGWFGRAMQQPLGRGPTDLDPLLQELVQHLSEIKCRGNERLWQARLEGASIAEADRGLASSRLQELITILTSESSQITGALVLAAGAALALSRQGIDLGILIAAMFFVWRVFTPIQMLFQALSQWQIVAPSLEMLNRFMVSAEFEPDAARSERWVLPMPRGHFELRGVSLRLNDLQEPALAGLTLSIPAGELVVFVGAEGSGRSVLLKLLQNHYRPGTGRVLLDGADLRQYPPAQLRAAIGYVPARPELFPGTLRDNLLLGEPTATDAELVQLCRQLALDALLEPPGLDRPVLQQGAEPLLPEQVYGLALARVLISRPTILMLEHPFTTLRGAQRQALLAWLREHRGTSTSLLVSEDPELMALADRLVLLRSGTVAFQGRPAELLARASTTADSPP
ncbi:MAG: ATP-binding cassette domain-containing protein [Prochlorococcaceae cyanobacterium]|jgi:ATP-binding cassette subfamily C protein LapB